MPLKYRSAYAKFRCEVASLRVETGRYERKTVHERTCLYCTNCVEDVSCFDAVPVICRS